MSLSTAVIILNYFGHEDTAACAESVWQHIENAAVFIVDNSACAAERSCLEKLFSSRSEVVLIFPQKNLGFAAGVNRGLQAALEKGFSRFFLLNNDALLRKGAGGFLQQAFSQHPGCLIAPAINHGGLFCTGNYYHRYFGLVRMEKPLGSAGWMLYLSGCALAFDGGFLAKNGFFQEAFFMYGEDVEFSARARDNKCELLCLKDFIIDHAGSSSSGMASFFYEYHVSRSHYLLTFYLCHKPLQRLLAVPAKALSLLLRALLRCIKFRTAAPLKAFCCAPFRLPVRPL
jgi:GT2 family glycosyltransferase